MAQSFAQIPPLSEKDKARFFAKVSKYPTESGCLEWLAGRSDLGYGTFRGNKKMLRSHRVAYLLATGTDPSGLCVCHHCDNPACCNPAHLFIGTIADNMSDKQSKGRGAQPQGEMHGRAKLTASDIPIIRLDKRFQRVIATDYGVDPSVISDIKRGKLWSHIA